MNDKQPTRGRPLSPRTLRDMALDDFADGHDELAAAKKAFAHAVRRIMSADTHMVRGYHRLHGAQEHQDREVSAWDGVERRRAPIAAEIAATLELAS